MKIIPNIVEMVDNEPRVSHRVIAEQTDNLEKSVKNLINKYMEDFETFGRVHFKNATQETNGGRQEVKTFYLNEEQATFLMTLLKNSRIVVNFKLRLVKEFYKMRENLKPQDVDLDKLKKRVELIHFATNLVIDYKKSFFEIGITRQEELGITVNRAVAKDSTVDFLEIAKKKDFPQLKNILQLRNFVKLFGMEIFLKKQKKLFQQKTVKNLDLKI
jgi:phage regulator Rha-like protein